LKKVFILLFFFVFFTNLAFSQALKNENQGRIRELILSGEKNIFQENYSLAQESFQKIINLEPENPAGYFFQAVLFQAEMMDFEDYQKDSLFYQNIEKSTRLAQELLRINKKDQWGNFFLGSCYGSLSLYESRKGSWWKGLRMGLKAKSHSFKAFEADTSFYDPLVIIGGYHYWSSVITKVLRFLPFISDKRKIGIEELKKAAELSLYSKETAENALIWIYLKEKKFKEALEIANRMTKKYPEGKSFLWGKAAVYYESYDWVNAINTYKEIVSRIESQGGGNHFNIIEGKQRIAQSLFNLGRFNECIKECKEVKKLPLEKEIIQRQKDKLREIDELLKKCLKITGKKG
jgi:tetratricopeptide (TPR) repeat protein